MNTFIKYTLVKYILAVVFGIGTLTSFYLGYKYFDFFSSDISRTLDSWNTFSTFFSLVVSIFFGTINVGLLYYIFTSQSNLSKSILKRQLMWELYTAINSEINIGKLDIENLYVDLALTIEELTKYNSELNPMKEAKQFERESFIMSKISHIESLLSTFKGRLKMISDILNRFSSDNMQFFELNNKDLAILTTSDGYIQLHLNKMKSNVIYTNSLPKTIDLGKTNFSKLNDDLNKLKEFCGNIINSKGSFFRGLRSQIID